MSITTQQTIRLASGAPMVGEIGKIISTEIRTDITTSEAPWVCITLEMWDGRTRQYHADYLKLEAFSNHIKSIMKTVKVQVWDELIGKELIALFDWEHDPDQKIHGICSTDHTNIYFADEVDHTKLLTELAAQTS